MTDISALKSRINIADIIGERVSLTQRGGKLWGNCPFHDEKTSSFSVNEEWQRFYCFGCQASGDVAEFIMRYEGVTFPEAIKILGGGDIIASVKPRRKGPQWVDIQDDVDYSEKILKTKRHILHSWLGGSEWVEVTGVKKTGHNQYLWEVIDWKKIAWEIPSIYLMRRAGRKGRLEWVS